MPALSVDCSSLFSRSSLSSATVFNTVPGFAGVAQHLVRVVDHAHLHRPAKHALAGQVAGGHGGQGLNGKDSEVHRPDCREFSE